MLLSVGEHLLICWKPKWNKREIRRNWSFSPASYWDLYHWFLWFSGLQIQTELWPLAFLGLQHSRRTVGFLSLHEDMSQFLIIKKNVCFYIYIHLLVLFLWKTLTNTVYIQVFYLVLSSTYLTKYQKEIHILWNIHLKIKKKKKYPLLPRIKWWHLLKISKILQE